jgi:hypothetical protein
LPDENTLFLKENHHVEEGQSRLELVPAETRIKRMRDNDGAITDTLP